MQFWNLIVFGEGFFASSQVSLRNQVLSRYPGFFRSLLESPSREVRALAIIVRSDPRSSTCKNLRYLEKMTGLKSELYCSSRIRLALPVRKVPDSEQWRLGLMTNLMKMKNEKHLRVEDTKRVTAMMDSLCSTWVDTPSSSLGDPITHTIRGPSILGAAIWWRILILLYFIIFNPGTYTCSNKSW